MDDRFRKLPQSLQRLSETRELAGVPALIAHPESVAEASTRVPAVIWMHGRTVYKELDPGRYQRWLRAGIGAIALDLPGHGERFDSASQQPDNTLGMIGQGVAEIDEVLGAMDELGIFDMSRIAIGGMSAGGMITLRRLCNQHPFVAACVESTTGDLCRLYFPEPGDDARPWPVHHARDDVIEVDPMSHLAGFRPIPLLALHNEGDEVVPSSTQTRFLDKLRAHYNELGADPSIIEHHLFSETGAPAEHAGFGRHANEAKNLQVAFLERVFGHGTGDQ